MRVDCIIYVKFYIIIDCSKHFLGLFKGVLNCEVAVLQKIMTQCSAV